MMSLRIVIFALGSLFLGGGTMPASDLEDPLYPLGQKYDIGIAQGVSSAAAKADVLAQQTYYNNNIATLQAQYPGKFVAISNNQVFAADTLVDAENLAIAALPNNQYYVGAMPPAVLYADLHVKK